MKICFVQNHSLNNEEIYLQSINNHLRYFDKHGYDFYSNISEYSTKFDSSVYKMLRKKYDYIITIGSDIYFTDMEKPIEMFINLDYDIILDLDMIPNFNDNSKVNYTSVNGDFIIFSVNLNDWFWKLCEIYNIKCTQDYINYILLTKHENIINQKHKDLFESIKKRIGVHSPRTMQSFMPYNNPMLTEKCYWNPGDFSVHFHVAGAGCDNELKLKNMKKFAKEFKQYI